MIVDVSQRWRQRRSFFVDPSRRFDPRGWEVSLIASDATARAFVEAHHYSHAYPAARRRFGLFAPGGALEGVAVFSVPVRAAALADCPTGYAADKPPWLTVWLLIIADNTMHVLINGAALEWL